MPEKLKIKFNERLPYYTCLKSRIEQQVVAKFIKSGKYQKHLEKLHSIYSAKRSCLVTQLFNCGFEPYMTIHGAECGTHIILTMNINKSETELRELAALNGVKILPLSACLINITNRLPAKSFIIGYGELSEDDIKEAVFRLKKAWL